MNGIASRTPTPIDCAAWAGLPVACVPVSGSFEPLPVGQRLLVAADGLYLEAANDALYMRLLLAAATVTPWGHVTPTISLRHGLIPSAFGAELVERSLDAHPKEMAALIVADPSDSSGYRLIEPEAVAGEGSVSYLDAGYEEGALVVDAHSHGHYPAAFSATDDNSDQSRLSPHISFVYGHCANRTGVTFAARACIGHYLLPIPSDIVAALFA